jgi:hypothetical protein
MSNFYHPQYLALANQYLEELRKEAELINARPKQGWTLTRLFPAKSKQKRPSQTICEPSVAIK